ncbi:MAG: HAD-IA family hydrolase [Candidatus Omnitrophica bacterium]|nr:HAD-IA family hydrolase [Candidatus Omnitrophota bacterium]MDD5487675.1 HAD-IA family hydrolase [Candidatus Omnitrophota bacterium]
MAGLEVVFFDLDGTLVDSSRDIVSSVNHMLSSMGLPERPYDEVISYIGGGVVELLSDALGDGNGQRLEEARNVFREYYGRHCLDTTALYPGVRDTLPLLGRHRVIVTNRSRASAEKTLRTLGVGEYFSDIIGGDDENCLKPSACPINKALVGGMRKEKCLMVGDMDVDIKAGKAAGIMTCGVTYGIGDKGKMIDADPDFIVDEFSDICKIVRQGGRYGDGDKFQGR